MGIREFLCGIISLGDESLLANISAIQTDPPARLPLAWRSNFKAWEHLRPFGSWPLCEKSSSRITGEHICGFLMRWRVIVNWTESIVFQKGNNKKNQMATTFFTWWSSLAFIFLYNTRPCWFKQWSGSNSMQFHAKYFTCNKRNFLLWRAYSSNKQSCNRWEPR